jgi:hypothetical protein
MTIFVIFSAHSNNKMLCLACWEAFDSIHCSGKYCFEQEEGVHLFLSTSMFKLLLNDVIEPNKVFMSGRGANFFSSACFIVGTILYVLVWCLFLVPYTVLDNTEITILFSFLFNRSQLIHLKLSLNYIIDCSCKWVTYPQKCFQDLEIQDTFSIWSMNFL